MKITYDTFVEAAKTISAPSSLMDGVWIARSGIKASFEGVVKTIFGYATSFNKTQAEICSKYELLEKLVFQPNFYNAESVNKPIKFLIDGKLKDGDRLIKDFLVGSVSHNSSYFYGNGCAIHNSFEDAIKHSTSELIERHLCCDIWYKRRALVRIEHTVNLLQSNASVQFFTTETVEAYRFALVVIDLPELDFFCFGAAVKVNLELACNHALGEAAMVVEDALKRRLCNSQNISEGRLLSLRNTKATADRKRHFETILKRTKSNPSNPPVLESIVFEPLLGFYAARTYSKNALDPRELALTTKLPILPLF